MTTDDLSCADIRSIAEAFNSDDDDLSAIAGLFAPASSVFSKEEEIAAPLIPWLTEQGWDVYQEVQVSFGGQVVDMVATMGRIMWAIEVKKLLSLDLLAQAKKFLGSYHLVSVAVPVFSFNRKTRGAALILDYLWREGIGVLTVEEDKRIVARGNAHMLRRPAPSDIRRARRALVEEQKTYAPAGNAEKKYWTVWQRACKEILGMVRGRPGITLGAVIREIGAFYYNSDAAAEMALVRAIRGGKVPGVRMVRKNKAINLFLSEQK